MKVAYTPRFIRMLKKLPTDLQDETIARIELFKDTKNHKFIKVHKLKGKLRKYHGFWLDFHNRVTFEYLSDNEVVLLTVGDHDVYK